MNYDRRLLRQPKEINKMGVNVEIKKKGYDVRVGTTKMAKNTAIFLLPSLVAYQTSVPQQWAWLLAVSIYMIKNWLENK